MHENFKRMFDIYTVGDKLNLLISNTINYITAAEELERVIERNGFPFNMVDRKLEIERYKFGLPYLYKRVKCKHEVVGEYSEEDYNPHSGHEYTKRAVYCKDCFLFFEVKVK